MMLQVFSSLVVPELIIALLVLLSVLIGAYKPNSGTLVTRLFIVGSAVAVYWIIDRPASIPTVLTGILASNALTSMMRILLLTAFAVICFNLKGVTYNKQSYPYEVPILMGLSVIGGMILIASQDLLVLYLGLELMSIPLYILSASGSSQSSEAGLKFFILGALSSCIYLFGTSIVYGFTTSTRFKDVADYYISIPDAVGLETAVPIIFLIAIILILVSLFFKISAAPFHMWTPDVYQGSPTIVTMFLSSIPKIAAFAVLINILYEPFIDLIDQWQQIIVFVAIASLCIGALGGIMQKDLKRMLAYSTIGHVGFILLGIAVGEISGLVSSLVYITLYVAMNMLIFSTVLQFEPGGYNGTIHQLSGLAKRSGWSAFIVLVSLLSMAGIPPFAGFFAKLYILLSVIESELYPLACVAVVATVISCFYYLRVVKIMYFDKVSEEFQIQQPTLSVRVLLILGVLINLGYALAPSQLLEAAQSAAESIVST